MFYEKPEPTTARMSLKKFDEKTWKIFDKRICKKKELT
jgi:hypothetical protein